MRYFGLILALGVCYAFQAVAQEPGYGSMSGFVTGAEDGEALIGASVFVAEVEKGTISNISGYYVIPKIAAGRYIVACTYIGYQRYEREIELVAGEDLNLHIALEPELIQAAETVVRADSARTADKLFEKTISQVILRPRQINQIPQVAEADLLRSLQTLPGILPLSDFSSALYVRGGTPDQNLYMVDGSDVYNPEHAFGIFSTFNTDAIKQVELSKGGFGAEYGGRLSSVLDVTNLDGNREQFEGTASISLLSTKSTLEMPLGGLGSLSGSIRRTYFDQTIGRRLDDIPDYYFYDGNIKAYLDLGERDKLTLSGFGGRDFLDVIFNNGASSATGFHADWGNKTGSIRWTRVFSPRLFGNFWLTASRFTSDFQFDEADVDERNNVTDATVKGQVEYHHSQEAVMHFGFEQKNMHLRFRQAFPAGLIDVDETPEHYVLYGKGSLRPSPLWDIEVGLRYNLFAADKAFHNFDPRFSLKYRLSEVTSIKAAAGIYHQYLHRIPRFIATDIWTTSNENQAASRAGHLILGLQREWARNWQFEIETFYKEYQNIYQFNQTFLTELQETGFDENNKPIFTNTKGLFNRGDGNSAGFEVMLRKDSGALTGWIGYSLARTVNTFAGINGDRSFAPRHDRTSTLNVVSTLDIRNGLRKIRGQHKKRDRGRWTLGLNLVYSTGQPITEPGSGYLTTMAPTDIDLGIEYAPTRINNVRLPYYGRVDVSLNYHRQFNGWSMAPYLQLFNAGNRKNTWFVNYNYTDGIPDAESVSMFPLLPTIGVNFEF